MKMLKEYRFKFAIAYEYDKKWFKILRSLKVERKRFKNELMKYVKIFNIQFVFRKDLIYYQNEYNNRKRLCIFKSLKQKIFELIYNKHNYKEFYYIYKRIIESYYLRHLIRRLKHYIFYCSKCQLNQTKKHAFYESLKSILTSPLIFYTIIIDFILRFSFFQNEFNIIMILTNNFNKKMISTFEKDIWKFIK